MKPRIIMVGTPTPQTYSLYKAIAAEIGVPIEHRIVKPNGSIQSYKPRWIMIDDTYEQEEQKTKMKSIKFHYLTLDKTRRR